MKKEQGYFQGYSIAILSAIVLSTTAIFIRYLTRTYQLPALILAFWRDIFVVATLVPIFLIFRPGWLRLKKDRICFAVINGFCLALFNSFLTLSVAMNGASVSTVLVYTSGAFTCLLGWIFLKEDFSLGKVFAVAGILGGSVFVSGAFQVDVWRTGAGGIIVGILSGFLYALYTIIGRSAARRGIPSWTALIYSFGFASVFLFLFNLIPGGFLPGAAREPIDFFWLGGNIEGWVILLLLAAGPTALGFGLYYASLAHLHSGAVNLIVSSEIVFAAIVAHVLLGEEMNGMQMFGGLMVLASVTLLGLFGTPDRRVSTEQVGNITGRERRYSENPFATDGEKH